MSFFVAQNMEDQWLDQNWNSLGLPDQGFFVEMGAGDGITYSNTYWLEKAKGWRGLLIEPDPRHRIENRSNSIIDRSFVGMPGPVSFGLCKDDPFLSGQLREHTEERQEMNAVTLSDLLQAYSIEKVDLISIDTEGTEMNVWNSLDLTRWKPTLAIVELVTYGLPDISEQVVSLVVNSGYTMIHQSVHNGIFKSNG